MNRRFLLKGLSAAPLAGLLLQQDALAAVAKLTAKPAGVTPAAGATQFPNPTLLTHEGKSVRFYDDLIRGKQVMLNFFFAGCADVCPGVTQNLTRVQKELGDRIGRDIFMYSISLAPEHDTPLVLKTYAEGYHVKPGWTFLTGARGDIETLRRRFGLVDPDPKVDADKSQHIGMVVMGNDVLDRWMSCPGMGNPAVIAKSVGWLDTPVALAASRAATIA
jgi:protein SCO1/2